MTEEPDPETPSETPSAPRQAPAGTADAPPLEPASPARAVVLVVLVALCFAAIYLTPLRDALEPLRKMEPPPWIDDARRWIREHGVAGAAGFTAICAVAVGVGVPRLAVAFVAGALFGWIEGTILAQFGSLAGSWATFEAGRHLGRGWVQALVARRFPKVRALLDFISRHSFEANVLLRLTPVGNAFATNLLFAVSSTSAWTFVTATFVGMLPQNAVAALVGSAAKGEDLTNRLLGAALAMGILGIGVPWWIRRRRARASAAARREPAPASD